MATLERSSLLQKKGNEKGIYAADQKSSGFEKPSGIFLGQILFQKLANQILKKDQQNESEENE